MPSIKRDIIAYLEGHPSYEMIMSALSEMGMTEIHNSMNHADTTKSGALKFQRPNDRYREIYFQSDQLKNFDLPRDLVLVQMVIYGDEEFEASLGVVLGIASYFGGFLDVPGGSGKERVFKTRSIPDTPVSSLVSLLDSDELVAIRSILSDPTKAAAVAEAIEHVWPQTHAAAPRLN
jgi:hypothetical protein